MLYRLLDIFFVVFHSGIIFFNLFGWIWIRTRKWNLVTLLLTGSSWLFLGLITGTLGYCPFTDWHFRVLEKLGKTNLPDSYTKYLTDRITGMNLDSGLIDDITLYTFLFALIISAILNLRDYLIRKK